MISEPGSELFSLPLTLEPTIGDSFWAQFIKKPAAKRTWETYLPSHSASSSELSRE